MAHRIRTGCQQNKTQSIPSKTYENLSNTKCNSVNTDLVTVVLSCVQKHFEAIINSNWRLPNSVCVMYYRIPNEMCMYSTMMVKQGEGVSGA